jgi:hypothetical protein
MREGRKRTKMVCAHSSGNSGPSYPSCLPSMPLPRICHVTCLSPLPSFSFTTESSLGNNNAQGSCECQLTRLRQEPSTSALRCQCLAQCNSFNDSVHVAPSREGLRGRQGAVGMLVGISLGLSPLSPCLPVDRRVQERIFSPLPLSSCGVPTRVSSPPRNPAVLCPESSGTPRCRGDQVA